MEFYALLTFSTIIIVYLALLIWFKTKNLIFPLGISLLYYWSLYGAWSIVIDKLGGGSGKYYHLKTKLFTIQLDNYYFYSLVLYALFIILVELTVLCTVKRRTLKQQKRIAISDPIKISHVKMLMIALFSFILSFFIIKNDLIYALELKRSVYSITRFSTSPFFTLHQIFNIISLFSLSIGLAVYASGSNAMFLIGKRNKMLLAGYIFLLLGMYIFSFALGNRGILFISLIMGFLIYINNCSHIRIMRSFLFFSTIFLLVILVGIFRGIPINSISSTEINFLEIINSISSILSSSEKLAAHFSMYGALFFHIPLTYGSSIISLLASVVPRIFWQGRPADIYPHYAHYVQAIPGQGYTIHHATGWYLNFGIFGVISGAMLFGYIWAKLYNNFYKIINLKNIKRSQFTKIFILIAPWCFTAGIPGLIRGSLEGYKTIIIEFFLIPTLIIYISSTKIRIKL